MNKPFFVLVLIITHFSFSFAQNFTDSRDGREYKTVKIENQLWMAENLSYATSNSWCYNDDAKNCDKYGRLYTWDAALEACPNGWRMPTDNDWETLVKSLGTKHTAGASLKDVATGLWASPNSGANNESGFTSLPSGRKLNDGTYTGEGTVASFWSLFNDKSGAWGRHLVHDAGNLNSFNSPEFKAYSLRCIKE